MSPAGRRKANGPTPAVLALQVKASIELYVYLQSSQEKWQRKAGWIAEAVGLVPGSGAGDVSAVEGGHRPVG